MTPVVTGIAVKMTPALVVYDLCHFTLTRLFSKHLTYMPRLSKVLAINGQCPWVHCERNGVGTASVRDVVGVGRDDQPAVLQLNAVARTHSERGPLVDSVPDHTICQVFRRTPSLPVVTAAHTTEAGLVLTCEDLPPLCGVAPHADEE